MTATAPPPATSTSPADEIAIRPGKPASKRIRPWHRRAYKWVVGNVAVLAIRLVRLLPFSTCVGLGRLGGEVAWFLRPGDRAVTLENLAGAFPEKPIAERRRIARESWARLGMSAMEWLAVAKIDSEIPARVTLVGGEHLDAARAAGHGVVWITGHVGPWELMAAAVARAGYPCSVIATTVRYPAVNRFTIAERGLRGLHTIEREAATSGRDLLKRLRGNEMIGILADHDTKVPSVLVDFFGAPAWTPVGPAELCLKLRAAMVSGFIERTGPGRWRVEISAPIPVPVLAKGDKAGEARAACDLTQAFTRAVEDHVRAHPEDWAWMHRRWK